MSDAALDAAKEIAEVLAAAPQQSDNGRELKRIWEKGDEIATTALSIDDFWAYMPQHSYIFAPTRAHWPASSVNSRLPPVPLLVDGSPVLDEKGKPKSVGAATWLDRNKPVEQMTWAPGRPMIIHDELLLDGGWTRKAGVACFNLYVPPVIPPGDASEAAPWVELVRYIYSQEADHILDWLAHRVQRPGEKINHALVLGGKPGIGKDTIVDAVADAIGRWNLQEASPDQMMTQAQNPYVKAIILRVSEARDLGDSDRFKFYDHTKSIIASPPPVLIVNEKYIRQYPVTNVCGVIITTNNTDGLYLPAEDRRHFVAWSEREKEDDFYAGDYWRQLWRWLNDDGTGHVTAWLRARNISAFDPKAPPPLTPAFWQFVNVNRTSQEAEIADLIDAMGEPDALTIDMLRLECTSTDLACWLSDPKNGRAIPHKLAEAGYIAVPNRDAKDRYWKIGGVRRAVYVKRTLTTVPQQEAAARKLAAEADAEQKQEKDFPEWYR